MKKLLLLSLFACPILAMQSKPTPEQLQEARGMTYAKSATVGALLTTGVGLGIPVLYPPLLIAGAIAGVGTKFVTDMIKGK